MGRAVLALALLMLSACPPGGAEPCPPDLVRVGDACVVPACAPGDSTCDGPLVRTCLPDRSGLSESTSCGLDQTCRADVCVPLNSCEDESPRCCAWAGNCGDMASPVSCEECRLVAREAYCDTATCTQLPAGLVGFYVAADARPLSASLAAEVTSAVVTIYRDVSADGRPVTCERILSPDGTGTSPHDRHDVTLNATISITSNVAFSMGSDVYRVRVPNVPVGDGQVVVVTCYPFANGDGRALARGCSEQVSPTAEGGVTVPLEAL